MEMEIQRRVGSSIRALDLAPLDVHTMEAPAGKDFLLKAEASRWESKPACGIELETEKTECHRLKPNQLSQPTRKTHGFYS